MSQSSSPLKLGKEKYGALKIKDAYLNAFKLYFGSENSPREINKIVQGTKSNDKLDFK